MANWLFTIFFGRSPNCLLNVLGGLIGLFQQNQLSMVIRKFSTFIVFLFLLLALGCKKSSPSNPIVAAPAPTISGISPASGTEGSTITITGTNFKTLASANTVKFNGLQATVSTASTTALQVIAPVGGSTGVVSVTTTDGSVNGPSFTYLPLPSPTISAISPNNGAPGITVTITGSNFKTKLTDNTVKFNGVAAAVSSATATQLVVTAPASGTTGTVTVSTSTGNATGPVFTYITGPTVYISGGQTNGDNGFWTNSKFTAISNWTNPRAIAGSGTDLYLIGSHSSNTPTYWKNGTPINLDSRSGYTVAMFIAGADVYTTGIITGLPTSPYSLLRYWKNGTGYDINTGPSGGQATSIFVSGTDVYVSGYRMVTSPYYFNACYWKNGSPVDLTLGTTSNATATNIFVSGTDVYVSGIEEEKSGNGIINKAPRLWKNGVSIPLTIPANSLYNGTNCIQLIGTDVYVGGQYNGKAAVWKNGTMINVAGYSVAEQISSMFLYNNTDLYVTGASSVWGMNGYWKNGDFVEMDPGCTTAGTGCAATAANNVTGIYVK